MSLRSDCIAKLATNLSAVTGIAKVVVANGEVDINQYPVAQLPLLAIRADSETANYETSSYAEWVLSVSVTLYFLAKIEEASAKETLITAVKNKIGGDPTLGAICEMCEIISLQSGGEYPLFREIISLKILFERSISNV